MNVRYCSLIICIVFLLGIGCVKEMDFDQAKDFEATPALNASLIYFDFPAVETGSRIMNVLNLPNDTPLEVLGDPQYADELESVEFTDTTKVGVFTESFFSDHLVEANVFYYFTNTTTLDYTAEVYFLTEDDQVVYEVFFDIWAGSLENPAEVSFTENFTNQELTNLLNTTKIAINLEVRNSPELANNFEGALVFNSSGTFYFLADAE